MKYVIEVQIPDADSRVAPPEEEVLLNSVSEATLQALQAANPEEPVYDLEVTSTMVLQ